MISIFIAIIFGLVAWLSLPAAAGVLIALLPTYLVRFQLGPIPITLLEVVVLIFVAVWLGRGGARRLWAIKVLRLWVWLGVAWIAVGTVSMFVAPDLRAAAGVWKAYIVEPVLMFFVFLLELRDERARRSIYYGLTGLAIILGGWLAWQWFTGLGIHAPWDQLLPRRATGPFGYPNANALLLAPVAVLLAGLAGLKQNLSRRQRIFFFFGALAAMLGVVLARSTGGLVGLTAGIFILLIWSRSTRWLAGIFATFLAGVVWLLPGLRAELLLQDWSGQVRLGQWQEAIAMLKDQWFLGAGLNGYQAVMPTYHTRAYIEIFMYPHNIFLNFWSELGLAGLILFLVIVFFVMRNSKFEIRNSPAVAAFAALLTHGLVDVPYFKNDLAILFWLILALVIVSHHHDERVFSGG